MNIKTLHFGSIFCALFFCLLLSSQDFQGSKELNQPPGSQDRLNVRDTSYVSENIFSFQDIPTVISKGTHPNGQVIPTDRNKELSLVIDNDALVAWQNIDQYYSYGIGLVLTFKSEKLAGLQNYFPSKKAYFFEAGLKVEGYTPSVKKISNFDNSNTTFDRPFAGILYGTLDVTYIFERSFFKGGILLGVLGPASMADEFQGWFHKNISDDITFDGWQFQIPNQPLLNLNFTYGYDFLPNQSWFNLFGVSQTRVGNLYIDATPIIGLRIGKFHKLSESVSMGNNIVSNSKRTELFFQSTISGTVSLFNATAQGNLFNNNFEFALESVNTFHSTISSGIYFSSSRFSGGLDHFFTFNKVLPVQHTYARAILKYRF